MRASDIGNLVTTWLLMAFLGMGTVQASDETMHTESADSLIHPGEVHFANLRQISFDGENAEAYFSPDGQHLVLQRTPRGGTCDQIYIMDVDGGDLHMVSTGQGRTTCAYFLDGGKKIIYSSTHLGSKSCPPPPDRAKGYVWAMYSDYDVFVADRDGTNLKRLTDAPGYDAEATVSPDGSKIIYTSMQDGDLDLYTMNPDGSEVRRLTDVAGYDGGAFYSHDGSKICFRAGRPSTAEERKDYKELLELGLLRPGALEIFVMNADGTGMKQLTSNGKANFCPYFLPDDQGLVFSSNFESETGREFDIYAIGVDGEGLERITYAPGFDGFPMFSPDGKKIVFASNRNNEMPRETNIFIADWVE
jgi:Tol biopolymer transport system component